MVRRYSPWTVPHGPDSILLDISGCAHLVGGEDRLGTELAERLARRGVHRPDWYRRYDRGAWAWRMGDKQVSVIAPGETRQKLALLPGARCVSMRTCGRRWKNWAERIGDLYPCRAHRLRAFRRWAHGASRRGAGRGARGALALAAAAPRWTRRRFAEPIATAEEIAAATHLLIEALCRHLADEALGVRLLILTLHRIDGESISLAVGARGPAATSAILVRLFASAATDRSGLGIEDMVPAAKDGGKIEARQLSLRNQNTCLPGGSRVHFCRGYRLSPVWE